MKSTKFANLTGISVVIAAIGALLVFSTTTQALTPLPDGGYAGNNTAEGTNALFHDTIGINNTALGFRALFNNTSGSYNNADGAFSLFSNTAGIFNTADGFQALYSNQSGFQNTAVGAGALNHNVTGRTNVAVGFLAGSRTNGNANILIGNIGVAGENSVIHIGTKGVQIKTFIAGIAGQAIMSNIATVCVDTVSGQIAQCPPSSVRFKEDIKPMDKDSEAILALKPVTFRYKKQLDPNSEAQFGLVAEEVAKINPDLVRYQDGQIFGVRYEAVNAMLLNEFLKEHQRGQEQAAKIAAQEKTIKTLTASLKHQAAQIEKVSADIALMKAKPQLVHSAR
jgi:uncharacterized coiled-coil protein SlyX